MSPPNDERNVMFTNAEEEVFVPECELVLKVAEDGEAGREEEADQPDQQASQVDHQLTWAQAFHLVHLDMPQSARYC